MCTIDPLYCWYHDNRDFWISHPEEWALASKWYANNNVDQDFLLRYAVFRRIAKQGSDSNLELVPSGA